LRYNEAPHNDKGRAIQILSLRDFFFIYEHHK